MTHPPIPPRRHGDRFRIASVALALAAAVVAVSRIGATAPPAPSLKVLAQTELPADLEAAMDVRWAGDASVYLALGSKGVVETPLVAEQAPTKEVIAGKSKAGGLWLTYHVAASPDYVVAAPPAFEVAWRRLTEPALVEEPFEYVHGIDIRGAQVAVVGLRADDKRNFAPDGAIAWIGSLDHRLADLKPIAFSNTGPGAASMLSCGPYGLGATRFLPDGTLLVIPGVQPGALLFSPEGRLLRTWDTAALGIDTDCASLTEKQVKRFAADYHQRLAWLDQRRTVDTILPLRQGPGLVIRTVENNSTHWDLRILHPDGTWSSSPLPLHGLSTWAHLRGDVRNGKVVLLLYEGSAAHPNAPRPKLITATIDG